jgi:outer membrane protein assembly factor BamD (BamD/ComL family)
VRRPPPAVLALVALLAGSGCLPPSNAPPQRVEPTARTEWPTVYARVIADSSQSRTGEADRELSAFERRYPGSPEAAEVAYWRALLKLDPNNAAAVRESITMLESYLATAPAGTHRTEAAVLRRLGLALEQRNAALAAVPPVAAVRPEDKARDEEITRLRDELSKANAELARIRRRLARPRP